MDTQDKPADIAGCAGEEPPECEEVVRELTHDLSFAVARRLSVTQTTDDAIIMTDAAGKIFSWNGAAGRLFGYAKADMLGKFAASIVAGKHREIYLENIRKASEVGGEGIVGRMIEISGVTRTGEEIPLELLLSAWIFKGKQYFTTILRDISERVAYLKRLENSVMGTIKVITDMSSLRDPYTVGHERRVAGIAVAIGAELGLDTHDQNGLRIAGGLHDVGKMIVPSELLSRPGRLTWIEFELIKQHAQSGYDLLRDIDFPWPIALGALQHHERMDGSGYPQGLKGDDIAPNARIIAVADVVEAISSHRPYRPALGIESALGEIESGAGTRYDSRVVEACTRLFRNGGFVIPSQTEERAA